MIFAVFNPLYYVLFIQSLSDHAHNALWKKQNQNQFLLISFWER